MATARDAARLVAVGFDGTGITPELRGLIDLGVRSVILFARNAGTPAEVATMVAEIRTATPEPILFCIDQEGGRTVRLTDGFATPPEMREIGGIGPHAAQDVGRILAEDLRAVGIDLDLAPVVDVDSNPDNPVIGPRSFGADPARVSECARRFIEAMQAAGVAACAKHFPGHGDTILDSHHDLPVLPHDRDRLERVELPPFRASIAAGVACIMSTHVVFEALDPGVPATLSPACIDGLLRTELGFEGVVISDDLEMAAIAELPSIEGDIGEAAVRSIEAGVDLVLCCHRPDRQRRAVEALIAAVDSGRISIDRLEASLRRLDHLFDRYVAG